MAPKPPSRTPVSLDYLTLRRRAGNFRSIINIAFKGKRTNGRDALEDRLKEVETLIGESNVENFKKFNDDIEVLEREFTAMFIYPAKKRNIVVVWIVALLAMLLVHFVIGPEMILHSLYEEKKWIAVTGPIVGHFLYYMPFRYVLYGAIIGSALILTVKNLKIEFDNYQEYRNVLNAPVVNFIFSVAISYVFLQLVKAGSISLSVFGLTISSEKMDGTALLLATIGISLAAEKYAERLVAMAQPDWRAQRRDATP